MKVAQNSGLTTLHQATVNHGHLRIKTFKYVDHLTQQYLNN